MQEDLTFNSIQAVFSQDSVELSWTTVLQQLAMKKPVTIPNIGLSRIHGALAGARKDT